MAVFFRAIGRLAIGLGLLLVAGCSNGSKSIDELHREVHELRADLNRTQAQVNANTRAIEHYHLKQSAP